MKRLRKKTATGTLFQLPSYLILSLIVFLPSFWAIFMSMTNYAIAGANYNNLQFTFLSNYFRLFTDPEFGNSLLITLEFAIITTAVEVSLSLILAIVIRGLNRILQYLYYVVILAGTILPLSVSIYMFINVFHFKYGILAQTSFIPAVDWFSSYAFLTVILCEIWVNIGWIFFLYVTSIDGVPLQYFELAELDSLDLIQKIKNVYFPQIKGVIIVTLLFGLINGLQSFMIIMSLTNGGPRNLTEVISLFAYKQAFKLFDFGYGTTANMILFLLIVVLLVPLNRSINPFGRKGGEPRGEYQETV